MKIAVAGLGKVGITIARMLSADGRFDIRGLDRLAPRGLPAGVQFQNTDFKDSASTRDGLAGVDAVVSALPHYLNPDLALQAKSANAHYLDLTESVASTTKIRALSEGASTAFIPQCGIAPGYVGILANSIANEFDEIDRVSIRAGGVPKAPINRLGYEVMWSIDGVVHEYCEPCVALRNGSITELEPMEGLEQLSIEGVSLEAFNTSGGLGTLPETLGGRARNLDYKSIRYPGHCELMKFLLDDLGYAQNREALVSLLLGALPENYNDQIFMQVLVIGALDGRKVRKSVEQVFKATDDVGGTAIEKTTASAATAVVDLLERGILDSTGFVKQEDIKLEDFLSSPFAEIYRDTKTS